MIYYEMRKQHCTSALLPCRKKGFLWNTNSKISILTIARTLPHWLSCAWENKATRGTKKRFFSMFTIKSFLYVCMQYRFALQVLQVF